MKKFLIVLLIILGCAGTGFAGYMLASHKMQAPVEEQQQTQHIYSPLDNMAAVSGDAVCQRASRSVCSKSVRKARWPRV